MDHPNSPYNSGPYERWNFGIGNAWAFPSLRKPSRWMTALAEFRKPVNLPDTCGEQGSGSQKLAPVLWGRELDENQKLKFLPFVLKSSPGQSSGGHMKLAELDQLIQETAASSGDEVSSRLRIAFPVETTAIHPDATGMLADPDWQADRQVLEPENGKQKITIVALIDDGIPFAHQNFRNKNGTGTRVEFCWLQSAAFDPDISGDGTVLFGREYTRENINTLIKTHGNDEDILYRAAGATDSFGEPGQSIRRHASHGSHVMDIAAGYAPDKPDPVPDDVRIIAVQLPDTIAWDTSGFGKDMYLVSALHYIFERADRIARGYGVENVRLVVNLSFGFSAGPHDGSSELEAAFDELVAKRRLHTGPTALVVPSGNSFLQRMHAVLDDDAFVDNQSKLPWRIQPNDRTSSFLEIWFDPCEDPAGMQICVDDPGGRFTTSIRIPSVSVVQRDDHSNILPIMNNSDQMIGQLSVDQPRGLDRWRALIAIAPTEPSRDTALSAPAGPWTISIKKSDPEPGSVGNIHCWIQRDDAPDLYRSGNRQSYFDYRNYQRFDDLGKARQTDNEAIPCQRFGSINGSGTGSMSLIVGGFMRSMTGENTVPAFYSSAGVLPWTPDPGNQNYNSHVNCSALSERGPALAGTIAAGARSGSLSMLRGTSAAAPFVARMLVEEFRWADNKSIRDTVSEHYLGLLEATSTGNRDNQIRARLGKVMVKSRTSS